MPKPNFVLSLLLAASFFLLSVAPSFAIDADHADDVCAPTDDPCLVTSEIDIIDRSILDFGQRTLRVQGGGRLDFQIFSGTILCGNFEASTSGAFLNASGTIPGVPETAGGLIQISARRGCQNDSSIACLRDLNCKRGQCNYRRCTAASAVSCSSNADCEGLCAENICTNSVATACSVNADCNLGPCPASAACSAERSRLCSSNADCDLGTCSVGTGNMTMNGNLNGNATEPAVVILRAAGDVVFGGTVNLQGLSLDSDGGELSVDSFDGSVTINKKMDFQGGGFSQGGELSVSAENDVTVNALIDANGGDFDGGVVEFFAGNDFTLDDTILANSISGEGFGGEVILDAGGDLTVTAGTTNNRHRIATEGHKGPDLFGGDGGTQEFTAGRDVILNTFTRFEGNGAEPDGLGADLFITADRNLFLDGEIESKAKGILGGGGLVQLETGGTLEMGANGEIDLFGGDSGGGAVELLSDGDIILRGLVDVSGGNGGTSGSTNVESGGRLTLAGTLSTNGSQGGVADALITAKACRVSMLNGGLIDNKAPGGINTIIVRESGTLALGSTVSATGQGGTNEIFYRDVNKSVVLNGTVTPTPDVFLQPSLVGCPVCGNGELDQGELCDDGNTADGDGCSFDCVDEGCIDDTDGYPGVDLCDDLSACTTDSCNTVTHHCENVFICNDGIACTNDICVDGACAVQPVDDNCEDSNLCTDNVCTTVSGCTFPNNTVACDDGDFCTVGDTCGGGVCVPGGARDCSDGVGCTVDSCNEAGDTCDSALDHDSCDDSLFCNGEEVCDAVSDCGSGTAVDCSGGDDQCLVGVCDEDGDICTTDPDNEGLACDDGSAATENDVCVNGFCIGEAVDCGDGLPCTVDTFDEVAAECVHTPNHALCDDEVFCNGAEFCSLTTGCESAAPVDCSGLDDDCNTGVCSEFDNSCEAVPANEAGACDDGLFCTVNDTCESGVCSGTVRSCDDGVACTTDSCDEVGGSCVATANDGACDNGLFCDGSEVCDETLGCQGGSAVDCSSFDGACTAGVCNDDLDACEAGAANEGDPCDDGSFCTVGDTCQSGLCVGSPKDCGDGVGCTVDSCDEINDICVNTTDDESCDNGQFCDGSETCDAVNDCVSGTSVDCSSLDDACIAGTCSEDSDSCVGSAANEGGSCDDADSCTHTDLCGAGVCAGAEIPDCGTCGNGFVEDGEDCDDGDTVFAPGELCGATCSRIPCGKPTNSSGLKPSAADALYILRTAVRLVTCVLSVCDVDGNGSIVAGDALATLRAAVGLGNVDSCPAPV